ncbi:SusC/RagA family TonB-linked outer membrane protein [Draconibacterium sp.]|nr:SusC/RagA family TonB-linked outer membrane protein [Draconibacterium sp.]
MKKLLLLVVALCIGVSFLFAQTKQITGKVTSQADGTPIPGVSVAVQGSTLGTVTDAAGEFTLNVPENEVLVFSFIGMKTVEVQVTSLSIYNVTLQNDVIGVDEVMVVAYGTAKRSSFTGSAKQINADELEKTKSIDIAKSMEGKIAGVQVVTASGQPGNAAEIRIRGIGSLNASQSPLYVLDGVPYNGNIASIDPKDIESYTVLKDASAAALYGSRASNGVIVITTKKGKKGSSKIEFTMDLGINTHLNPFYDVVSSPEDYNIYSWEALKNWKQYGANPLSEAEARQWASDNLVSQLGGYSQFDVNGDGRIDETDTQLVMTDGSFNPSANRLINDSWEDELIENGLSRKLGLNFSGGNDKTTYFTSFNYNYDEGYVKQSDFNRLTTTVNLNHQAKPWLKVNNKLSYSYFKQNASVDETAGRGNNAFAFVNNMPSVYPVFMYDYNAQKINDPLTGGYMYDYSDGTTPENTVAKTRNYNVFVNPVGAYELDENYTIRNEINTNSSIEINFLKDFKLSSTFGLTWFNDVFNTQYNSYYGDAKGKGLVSRTINQKQIYTWNQILTWMKQFDKHTLSAMAGHEAWSYKNRYTFLSKDITLKEKVPEFDNAILMTDLSSDLFERSIESYISQVKYDYDSKYFLNFSYRRDGSSRFANNHWGDFWSAGASWQINEESFLADYGWIDLLKIKASYGVQGNESLDQSYPSYDLLEVQNLNGSISIAFSEKGNPNLTWESNKTFNSGIEVSLWDKLSAEVEYFIRDTYDMLYLRDMPLSLGYSTIWVNDLDMRNQGLEFTINYSPVTKKDFNLSFSLNGGYYKNKITKMPVDLATGEESLFIQNGSFGYEKGRSIYDRYLVLYAGVDSETGEALYQKAIDGSGNRIPDLNASTIDEINEKGEITWETTNVWADGTRTFEGSTAVPDLTGGFGTNMYLYGFTLDLNFMYQIGGKSYDAIYRDLMNTSRSVGVGNYHAEVANRWQKPGDVTDVPRLTANLDKDVSNRHSRWLTNASYLGLTNASLGYTLPSNISQRLRSESISLNVTGNNLFMLTKRQGFYPSGSWTGTSSDAQYMPLSTISFGVKVVF